jgi:hypothetical protein
MSDQPTRHFIHYRAIDRKQNIDVRFYARSRFNSPDPDDILAAARKAIGPARDGFFRIELSQPLGAPSWIDMGLSWFIAAGKVEASAVGRIACCDPARPDDSPSSGTVHEEVLP